MFKADLLYSDEEYVYKKPKIIEENVLDDLKISRIFEFCAPLGSGQVKKDDVKHTLDVLRNPCTLKKDVLFRQETFKTFLRYDHLVNHLYKVLEDVIVLNKIKDNYDFAYGSDKDIEYLKAVNYIFFLKSYKLFLNNIHAVLKNIAEEANRDALRNSGSAQHGLHKLFLQIELEKNKMDADDIAKPIEQFLSYFADKKNISGELRTQNGVFTKLNFDTDIKNIKTSNPNKIQFLDLIKSVEDHLGIYKPEYEIKTKGSIVGSDSAGEQDGENAIYLPDE